MADLAAFLAQAARTPFAWGRFDCCLWLSDWILLARGVDPGASFRGRYSTALGCARVLNKNGGVLGVVAASLSKAGFAPTDAPGAGAVGVVEVWDGATMKPAGGICTGRRWAVLAPGGLICAPMTTLAAWRV